MANFEIVPRPTELDFSNVCRLCLDNNPNNIDIFSDTSQKFELNIQSVVWKLFNFWIHPEDGLPKTMCQTCIQKIYTFHIYSTKVKEVQIQIQEIIDSGTNNLSEETTFHNLSNSLTPENKCKINDICNSSMLPSPSQSSPDTYETLTEISADIPHVGDPWQFLNEEASSTNIPVQESQTTVEIKVEVDPLMDEHSRSDSAKESKDNVRGQCSESNVKVRTRTEKKSKFRSKVLFKEGNTKQEVENGDCSCTNESSNEVAYSNESNSKRSEVTKKSTVKPLADRKKNWTERSKQRSKLTEQLQEFYKFKCLECTVERRFPTYHQLNIHSKKHHGVKGYVVCCNQRLQDKNVIKSHMLKHLSPGIFRCQECGKELANKESLENHLVKHMPEESRPFKCSECGRGFPSKGGLTAHRKSHLPEEERLRYVCDTCGKRFPYQTSLNSHKKYVHLNLRLVMCHICPKTFVDKASLNSHIHTHLTNERVQCAECGRWFKNQINLRAHMKTHEGLIFPCMKCSKVFSTKHRLGEHLRGHTDARPHQCTICSKSFKVRAGLKTHMVQHTGEKPYQCPYCSRSFASSGNFSTHKKRMHGAHKAQILPDLSTVPEFALHLEKPETHQHQLM